MHQGKKVDRSGAPLTPAVPFLRVSHTYSADPFSHVCNALFSQLYTKALARPWKHVVIEMTEQAVKNEWKCYMQLSALDGQGKSLKAKQAKAALRQQEPSLDEQRRILIARGRLKYNLDVLALKDCMSIDAAEAKVMRPVSFPHTSIHELWVKDKEGKRARELSRRDAERTKDSRPSLGYAARYRKYLEKVKAYNQEVDEWNEQNEQDDDFVPMPHQVPVPKGAGACCIDASQSIDEQHAEIEVKRAEGLVLTDVHTKPRGKLGPDGYMLEWSTNQYTLVEAKSLLCYQAAVVLATTLQLSDCGIPRLSIPKSLSHPDHRATFTQLNIMFDVADGPGSAFRLSHTFDRMDSALEVFSARMGTFLIHSWHYIEEDMDAREYTEGITHYVVWNATNRLLHLYPEVRCPS